jgi:hypothetical protein
MEKIVTVSPKKHKPTKLGNYKTFRTCKQKCYGYGSTKGFFFFERNGKIHYIEKHRTEKVEGPSEDKPKSTEARKFTKRYYHSKVVDNTI